LKALLIFKFIILTSLCQAQDSIDYANVYYKNEWRIIDRNGEFIREGEHGLHAINNLCFGLEPGLSYQEDTGKFGFVDIGGKMIIPHKFDKARCFYMGRAPVLISKKWGFIDRRGDFVVQPLYDNAGIFLREGVAAVLNNGKIGFVDTTGQVVIPFQYGWKQMWETNLDFPYFVENRLPVIQIDTTAPSFGKVGCIDVMGQLVIGPSFDYISEFENGIATAVKGQKVLLIDTSGRSVMEFPPVVSKNNRSIKFVNGYADFEDDNGRKGVIKYNGEIIVSPQYSLIFPFSEGFAAVDFEIEDEAEWENQSGYIDTTGKLVFDRRFEIAGEFREGYAPVKVNDKWGFIDRTGSFVLELSYDVAGEFSKGMAIVGLKGRGGKMLWGWIGKSGDFVIKPIYEDALDFECGLARVRVGNKYGFINLTGKMVIKPIFDNALSFERVKIEK
jgi:hypothetical protein